MRQTLIFIIIVVLSLVSCSNQIPNPNISFGKSVLGTFVPLTSFPIQTNVNSYLDLNYALAAAKDFIIQFEYPENDKIKRTKQFNAIINTVQKDTIITSHNIPFYQVESNGLIFRSYINTTSVDTGKPILLVAMETKDSLLNYPNAFVFKSDTINIKFTYSIDNSQF